MKNVEYKFTFQVLDCFYLGVSNFSCPLSLSSTPAHDDSDVMLTYIIDVLALFHQPSSYVRVV